MRRALSAAGAGLAGSLVLPPAAVAHGIVGRADLPIPEWLFAWGAAVVLVVSFLALGILWRRPRLEDAPTRRLVPVPRVVEVVCGAIGIALFVLLVVAGFTGAQTPTQNILPTFVYVIFWVGLVAVSALAGDVFRAFNPWRAAARGSGWLLARAMGGRAPDPLPYPESLGYWPAVVGLLAFGWLELVSPSGDVPRVLATLALLYAAVQLVGMSLYGIDRWTDRADAFSVYFSLFARLSPLTARDGHLELRRVGSGLTQLDLRPGIVAFLCAAIGITAFDGASEGALWASLAGSLQQAGVQFGLSLGTALQVAFTFGLLATVALVAAIYRFGVLGMRTVDLRRGTGELSRRFVHSLVPIAFAYVIAHYFSLLVFQGQATAHLVSDPLGTGADVFGTAATTIDYSLVSATAIWYVQVGVLVVGHAVALAVAHDRALVDFGDTRAASRSQHWMLAVMVSFTGMGLWLLSAANA